MLVLKDQNLVIIAEKRFHQQILYFFECYVHRIKLDDKIILNK